MPLFFQTRSPVHSSRLPAFLRKNFLLASSVFAWTGGFVQAQIALQEGDLIVYEFRDAQLVHVSRDTAAKTVISGQEYNSTGALLFQNTGEIVQHSDGRFYIVNSPYDHTMVVDTDYNRSESGNLVALEPAWDKSEAEPWLYGPGDSLAVAADGAIFRHIYRETIGSWEGAIFRHDPTTGVVTEVSGGNFISSDIAAIDFLPNGTLIVAQDDDTPNLILLDPETAVQEFIGASAELSGGVEDIETLAPNAVALATATNGLVLATFSYDPITEEYSAVFTNHGDFGGGFISRVKKDPLNPGDLLLQLYYGPYDHKILLYDPDSGSTEIIFESRGIDSFAPVEHPTIVEKRVQLTRQPSGELKLQFFGTLQESENLETWQTIDPQPNSPFSLDPATGDNKQFFRVQ